MSVFDIKDAIDEIRDTLEDKIKMKKISCDINIVNMPNERDRIVKTDQKRM